MFLEKEAFRPLLLFAIMTLLICFFQFPPPLEKKKILYIYKPPLPATILIASTKVEKTISKKHKTKMPYSILALVAFLALSSSAAEFPGYEGRRMAKDKEGGLYRIEVEGIETPWKVGIKVRIYHGCLFLFGY